MTQLALTFDARPAVTVADLRERAHDDAHAHQWLATLPDAMPASQAWAKCSDPQAMAGVLVMLLRHGLVRRSVLALAACALEREACRIAPPRYADVLDVLSAVERWARGECALDDVRAAGDAVGLRDDAVLSEVVARSRHARDVMGPLNKALFAACWWHHRSDRDADCMPRLASVIRSAVPWPVERIHPPKPPPVEAFAELARSMMSTREVWAPDLSGDTQRFLDLCERLNVPELDDPTGRSASGPRSACWRAFVAPPSADRTYRCTVNEFAHTSATGRRIAHVRFDLRIDGVTYLGAGIRGANTGLFRTTEELLAAVFDTEFEPERASFVVVSQTPRWTHTTFRVETKHIELLRVWAPGETHARSEPEPSRGVAYASIAAPYARAEHAAIVRRRIPLSVVACALAGVSDPCPREWEATQPPLENVAERESR